MIEERSSNSTDTMLRRTGRTEFHTFANDFGKSVLCSKVVRLFLGTVTTPEAVVLSLSTEPVDGYMKVRVGPCGKGARLTEESELRTEMLRPYEQDVITTFAAYDYLVHDLFGEIGQVPFEGSVYWASIQEHNEE